MNLPLPLLLLGSCLLIGTSCLGQVPPFNETCVSNAYPPPDKMKVPVFRLSLNEPPSARWRALVRPKAKQIEATIKVIKDLIRAFPYGGQLVWFVDNDLGFMADLLPHPFNEEIKGISEDTGIKLGEIVLYNIFYEVFSFCTSIIGQDSQGKWYHARNLDFGLFLGWDTQNQTWPISEALRPLVSEVHFYRDGRLLFKSVHFAGYTGVLTGMNSGFTLTVNERFALSGGYVGIIEWLLGDRSAQWMGFLTRSLMENSTDYSTALHTLTSTKLISPAYYILAGRAHNEGSIITRSRNVTDDVWRMNSTQWYLLETNYDHWKPPLFLDDRRTPANTCMRKMGQQNMSFRGLFNVLSSKPVLNKLTVYTALMSLSNNNTMVTYLQDCPDPCWPW